MFSGCSSLIKLNLSNFNFNIATKMREMFRGCSSLKELDLPNFYAFNINNMRSMFAECSDELKKKIIEKNKSIKSLKEIFN